MSKWKLFGKSKKEEKIEYQEPVYGECIEEKPAKNEENQNFETENQQEIEQDQPLAEHHEELHSNKNVSKTGTPQVPSNDQRIWRDVEAIEENIDNMHIKTSENPDSEFEKKVDNIIKKKEKK